MKRFALSALSVLLAAGAIAPLAKPAEAKDEKPFSIHHLHTIELERRNKNSSVKNSFNIHQRRLTALDSRNEASLDKVPLLVQRGFVA